MKFHKTRKKCVVILFFTVVLIVALYAVIHALHTPHLQTLDIQPPYVYRGVAHHGSSHDAAINKSYSEGERNWEIEYILTVHDGSPIEVRSYADERQYYAEANDIGWMRLTPNNCPYVDDIVTARYQVDWLKSEPFYSGGYLDLESGLFYWEDGMPVIDGYGYQNDILKFRKVECQLWFELKDGRSVIEWATLYLQIL